MKSINKNELLTEAKLRYAPPYQTHGIYSLIQVAKFIKDSKYAPPERDYSCTVVIPVFNGLQHLRRLIPSLLTHTPQYVHIIAVNDCSTDELAVQYLKQTVKDNANWVYLENDKNLGFVATVNYAMSKVTTNYAILLNTDTEVPSLWIEKMLSPFYEIKGVATTTPFTNSGVCFSFPNYMADNEVSGSLEEINAAFSYITADEYGLNEIYSGTGFCMAINMECWNQIGPLDYNNFGKGYGEENDWCFRALQAGWRHLLVPNLFVSHYHGGSFLSEEKKKLCEDHQAFLKKKYPEFMDYDVPVFQKTDPWCIYRSAAALLLSRSNCLLFIDIKLEKNQTSGASAYSERILKEEKKNNNSNIIIAQYSMSNSTWELVLYSSAPNMTILLNDVSDLNLLFRLVEVKKVIVNNLAYCNNIEKAIDTLIFLKNNKQYSFSLAYNFHDYLSVCPSFFLVNKDTRPCNPCDYEYCRTCIKENTHKAIQRITIQSWRRMFSAFFEVVDSFEMFSYYTKSIVLMIYPEIENRTRVTYHETLMSENASKYLQPDIIKEIRIAFVGNFIDVKGAAFYVDLASTFIKNGIPAKFYLIGFNSTGMTVPGIETLGKYDRDNLGDILSKNKINLVVYPSINNETFSYVVQELMLLSVPLVVFPCGAPQERIRNKYEFGEVADAVNLQSLCEATIHLIDKLFVCRNDYCCLSKDLKEKLADIKNMNLELQYLYEQQYISPMKKSRNKGASGEMSKYVLISSLPPLGVKEALKIFINKYIPFLFRKSIAMIPPGRNIGLKQTIKIWIIKKMIY